MARNAGQLAKGVDLKGRLAQTELAQAQLERVVTTLIARHYDGAELPPEVLRSHVGMSASAANFWAQGINSSSKVLDTFGENPGGPILDWGCGSGRTRMWLAAYPQWERNWHGCDVDREAVDWLGQHGVANAEVCDDDPPLPYGDRFFTGIFAFSVLTHIHPDRYRRWFTEIRRVLADGAVALLTTHGPSVAEEILRPGELRRFRGDGYAYVPHAGHYKDASIVSDSFVRQAMTGLLEVHAYGDGGYQNQDTYLVGPT